jgi:excisionase family DNA binding protein
MLNLSLPPTQDKLNTIPDAAARLGISARKMWRLVATREIRAVKVGLRGTRVSESELSRYMQALVQSR